MFHIQDNRVFILLALLTLPLISVSSQQKKTDEAAVLIAEARAAWQKGSQWPAIETMKKAIALEPTNAATHTELANMYLAMKNYESARSTIAEALRLNPNYAPAHHRKAVLLRFAGDYEGSIAAARLALSLNPDDQTAAYSYVTIGRALTKLKKFTEADGEFRQAVSVYEENVKRKGNDASAHAALGDLLFQLQDYEKAENSYRRAVELEPKDFSFVLNLARSLDNQGKTDEAIRYYQEYLRLDPTGSNSNIQARIKWLQANPLSKVVSYLLVDAAENGKLSNVRALIAKGADVNFRDNYKTPLYSAAEGGYLEVVKVLLEQGARDQDAFALVAAYEGGHAEIEKLLESATPQSLSPEGVVRLLRAAVRKGDAPKFAALLQNPTEKGSNELLLYAVSQKKAPPVEIVRTLLEKGAKVNEPTKWTTALMHAAGNGHVAIAQLLLAHGAEVNTQTNEGTALIHAVKNARTEMVKVLLAAGADMKATWGTADQVLIRAADLGYQEKSEQDGSVSDPGAEIVQLLLARGADPNARGQYGQTALMHANTPAKVNLLIANRAELDAKDEQGKTALMEAAGRGDAGVVMALLDKGADVNAVDQTGNNALLRSLQADNSGHMDVERLVKRRSEVARMILQAKDVNLNAQNLDGETALMRAVRLENIEMVKLLLSKGADVNRSDVFGDTALTLAYDKGNSEIERLLPRVTFKGQPRNVLNAFLRAAIDKKDEATVKALLAEGADPNYEYGIGYMHKSIKRTVLVLGALRGHPGIVQMLLDKGANVNAKGLIYGSESGLKFGTALEAAESSQNTAVAAILRKAMGVAPD